MANCGLTSQLFYCLSSSSSWASASMSLGFWSFIGSVGMRVSLSEDCCEDDGWEDPASASASCLSQRKLTTNSRYRCHCTLPSAQSSCSIQTPKVRDRTAIKSKIQNPGPNTEDLVQMTISFSQWGLIAKCFLSSNSIPFPHSSLTLPPSISSFLLFYPFLYSALLTF